MKSTVLTAALVAAYGSDQAHLSGGEAHDAARHQEECDAGIVVNCQVEEGWQWSACDETCGYDRVPYAYTNLLFSHTERDMFICARCFGAARATRRAPAP